MRVINYPILVYSYWDFTVGGSEDYSYVRAAANAGYSTFRYDRLGTGLSEKPNDAYKCVLYEADRVTARQADPRIH